MTNLNKLKFFALALSALCFSNVVRAESVEVVQSVPLETTFGVPGVRMTQDVWLEMINAATTTLDLEQFYVSDQAGEELSPVLAAIQRAAARGVKVRLLVDAKFFVTYPDSVKQLGSLPNIESRTIDFSSTGGVQHAKFFIVDGNNSFVGSQNFDWRALNQIHEIGLRIADPNVATNLEAIFNTDWPRGTTVGTTTLDSMATSTTTVPTDPSLTVVASPANINPQGIGYTGTALVDLIAKAKKCVRIQVMDYTTKVYGGSGSWNVLDEAIREAAKKGIKIELVVDVSDLKSGQKSLQALAKLPNVAVSYVTVPQWSGGKIPFARLIHSKYCVIDDNVAWVGSENWVDSYFLDTRDVGVVTTKPEIAAQLGQVFTAVWTSAYVSQVH